MQKKVCIAAVLFSILAVFSASTALGFNVEAREAILADSMEFAPLKIREYLEANMDQVVEGLLFDYRSYARVDPRHLDKVYNGLIKKLSEGNLSDPNTARAFGVLACYVTEAVSPGFHNISDDVDPPLVVYDGFEMIPGNNGATLIEVHGKWWGDNRLEVLAPLYEMAVNEIVDYWVSAWKKAGLNPGQEVAAGKQIERDAIVILLDQDGDSKSN